MPLNATSYLEEHGWQGKGVPLDGKEGRGLKKPLALPMKRNLKGLGKDRDRATEWWDCLFEAGAKSINIQVGESKHQSETSASQIALEAASTIKQSDAKTISSEVAFTSAGKVSLVSQAKREYARKMLMSGFVRGRENRDAAEEELEKAIREQEKKRVAKMQTKDESPSNVAVETVFTKAERAKLKEEKRKRREARRLKKEAKETRKLDRESHKKRKRDKGKGEEKNNSKKVKEVKKAKGIEKTAKRTKECAAT